MRKIPVEYSVDKGVPIPVLPEPHNVPVRQLEVGESVLFDAAERYKIQTLASRLKKSEGKEFTVRKVSDRKCRVWRVK